MIKVSSNQSFNSKEDYLIPLYKEWEVEEVAEDENIFIAQKRTSKFHLFNISPENVLETYGAAGYSNFIIKTTIEYNNGSENWLRVVSQLYPINNFTQALAESNSVELFFDTNVNEGLYKANVKFEIEAISPKGENKVISSYKLPITYRLFGEDFKHEPLELDIYATDSEDGAFQLKLEGNFFYADIPQGFEIVNSQNAIVTEKAGNYTIDGRGVVTIDLKPKADYLSSLQIDNKVSTNMSVMVNGKKYAIPINVTKINMALVNETPFKKCDIRKIIANNRFIDDIKSDKFIKIKKEDLGGFSRYTVKNPCKITDLLTNPIKIELIKNENPIKIIRVPINDVPIFDNMEIDFDEINFTKNLKNIIFYSLFQSDHYEIELSVAGNDYVYKMPLFKGKATINLGDSLHRNLHFNYPEELQDYYQFRIPTFNIVAKKFDNKIPIWWSSKTGVKIMKGWKPRTTTNTALLSHCLVSRHSKNSFAFVNVLSLTNELHYKISVNGELKHEVTNESYPSISVIRINFKDLEVLDGDVVDFEIIDGEESLKKTFVIQQTLESRLLIYKDSFGLPNVLECFGLSEEIESERDLKMNTVYRNHFYHKQRNVIYSSNTFKMNTGFILKTQHIEIDELLDSTDIKMYLDDTYFVDLTLLSDKMKIMNSGRFLNSYELEFQINRNRYAQDYSF